MKKSIQFWLCIIVLCIIPGSVFAQPYISTFAGNGIYAFSGDGTGATAAQLNFPYDVAMDASGNMYIADANNNRIRKVNPSGVISTIAGTGVAGFSGDGGQATAAQFHLPDCVSVDASGNIYVSDTYNNRIRKINTSGIISTIAGTGSSTYSGDGVQATATGLCNPEKVAFDASGNIYLSDTYNDCIRKINSSGIITTFAGINGMPGYSGEGIATANKLSAPLGIAFDASGNLYIADGNNNRIRKVSTAGIMSTIAGTGTPAFSGDGGQATAAELWVPVGVSVDNSGNICITDTYNNRIRKINSSGVISTIAGNGINGYSGDGGPATNAALGSPNGAITDPSGNIFIADDQNNRIRKINTSGVISTVAGNGYIQYSGDGGSATNAELNNSASVAFDAATGDIYITDGGNSCLRKVSGTTGNISTIAGIAAAPGFSGDGGVATMARLFNPINVAISPAGDIVFCDSGNSCLRKVSGTTGNISTIAGNQSLGAGFAGDGGSATAAQISNSCSMCFDAAGNLYIADGGNACLRKVSGTTGNITTIAGIPGVAGFSGDGGVATNAKLNSPTALAIDDTGNIYIADAGNSCLRKVSGTTGSISTIAGTPTAAGFFGDGGPALAAKLDNPSGIAVTSTGKIFISDKGNSRMRVINPATGIIKTVAGTDTVGFNGDGLCTNIELNHPQGVCLDASNNCYIADRYNNRVRYVNYLLMVSQLDEPATVLKISPNPSNGIFALQLATPESEKMAIIVTNILGQSVGTFSGTSNQPVNISLNVPAGVYVINVKTATGNWSSKIEIAE